VAGGEPVYSATTEDFYYYLDAAIGGGPCIYVEDSMDGLATEDDLDKLKEVRKARASGKEVSGSYGTSKAKQNSAGLRLAVNKIAGNGSILIIIAQTRDNIGFGAQFNPKTRSGGTALRFYATGEIWFSIKESIKKTVRGKARRVGTKLKLQVKKNRESGREPSIEVLHYPSVGFDDIGSCVNYLIEEGHWSKSGGGVSAPEFDFKGKEEKLVEHIIATKGHKTLKATVAQVWREIDEACKIVRDNKYV
jgi:hypothetical protein